MPAIINAARLILTTLQAFKGEAVPRASLHCLALLVHNELGETLKFEGVVFASGRRGPESEQMDRGLAHLERLDAAVEHEIDMKGRAAVGLPRGDTAIRLTVIGQRAADEEIAILDESPREWLASLAELARTTDPGDLQAFVSRANSEFWHATIFANDDLCPPSP